ncbi:MAG: Sapep family Mn(2+)-dependent dipeptidase [Eubacteriales bacterium]|nr:Sapep family Mn(2+)-dependent dipeptidase [Eubacteriales bacterium]
MELHPDIRARKAELLDSLSALIQIASVADTPAPNAPYGAAVAHCLNEMLALCRRLGLRTGQLDRRVGWCEYGTGEQMIAVLGHLDVVPAGDGWRESTPFSGEIKNGRVYGRGAMDDKGPMVAAVYALAALKDAGFVPTRRIRVLFGTNEETGCGDMAWYRTHGGELPVMGFTPDGAYPIINGEKGIFTCTYAHTLHQTDRHYILTRFEGGTASNVVPDHAVAELRCSADAVAPVAGEGITVTALENGWRVEARGVSAHGSTPEQGENAIGRLAMALAQLPLTGELGECMAFLAGRIGMETRGESFGLAMRDELSGDLTVNLGTAAFARDTLSLSLSIRYPVTLTKDAVYPRMTRAFALGGFAEVALHHDAALYVPPESELIGCLSRVYEAQTGQPATLLCIGGGTYAKSMPGLVAFGPAFPGDVVREHQPDEYIEVERLLQNAEMIAAAMVELAK